LKIYRHSIVSCTASQEHDLAHFACEAKLPFRLGKPTGGQKVALASRRMSAGMNQSFQVRSLANKNRLSSPAPPAGTQSFIPLKAGF